MPHGNFLESPRLRLKHCFLNHCNDCQLEEPLKVTLSPIQITYLKSIKVTDNQVRLLKAQQTLAKHKLPLIGHAFYETELTARQDFQDIFINNDSVEFRRPEHIPLLMGLIPQSDRVNLVALGIADEVRKAIDNQVFIGERTEKHEETRQTLVDACSPKYFGKLLSILKKTEGAAENIPPRSDEELDAFWNHFSDEPTALPGRVIHLRTSNPAVSL